MTRLSLPDFSSSAVTCNSTVLSAQRSSAAMVRLNYIIHSSKKKWKCLEQPRGRIVLHFLPPCRPDENAIERRWLDVHSHVTRNHRCGSIGQLVGQVNAYLRAGNAVATASASGCDLRGQPELLRESRSVVV